MVAGLVEPTKIWEFAPAAGPYTAAPTWIDITQWVKSDQVDIHIGRMHEIGVIEPGAMTFLLNNLDGRFDPDNTAGPYYPIQPYCPVRFRTVYNAVGYPVFSGFIESLPTDWPTALQAWTKVKAVDLLDLLNRKKLSSLRYQNTILGDSPSAYLRLGEPPRALTALDASGHGNHGTYKGFPVLGSAGALITDTDTAVEFPSDGTTQVTLPSLVSGTGAFAVEFWFKTTNGGGVVPFFENFGSGAGNVPVMFAVSSTSVLFQLSDGAGTYTLTGTPATSVVDGLWHHIVGVRASDGRTRTLFCDSVVIGTLVDAAPINISAYPAFVSSGIAVGPPVDIDEFAVYGGALSAAQVKAHFDANGFGLSGQTSGQRIGTYLDIAGIPASPRALDAGRTILPGVTASLTDTFVKAAIDQVEASEEGIFYIDGASVPTFLQRDRLMTAPYTTSKGAFVDSAPGAGEYPYQRGGLKTDRSMIDVFNEVTVGPSGGPVQIAADVAAQTTGIRSRAVTTLVTDPAENQDHAQFILNRSKDQKTRVKAIVVRPFSDAANMFPLILGLKLWDRITAKKKTKPGGATAFTQDAVIEGITHRIRPGLWETELSTSVAETTPYWIWGISAWGVDTRFAY